MDINDDSQSIDLSMVAQDEVEPHSEIPTSDVRVVDVSEAVDHEEVEEKRLRLGRKRSLQSRVEYEKYVADINKNRDILENPFANVEVFNSTISQLDRLYEQFVDRTTNTRIIETDQHAFRRTADHILERMKKQSRGVPGEITFDSFVDNLADDSENKGIVHLEMLGAYYNRYNHLAFFPSLLPSLDYAGRRQVNRKRLPSDRPTTAAVTATEDHEKLDTAERLQGLINQDILNTLSQDEVENNYEPLSIYELCYDKTSFVNTLENFFCVSTLIKENKLWLGANNRNLPVVGTVENRKAYLDLHPNNWVGPKSDLSKNDESSGKAQFNWNFNEELYALMRKLYGEEPPMIYRAPSKN